LQLKQLKLCAKQFKEETRIVHSKLIPVIGDRLITDFRPQDIRSYQLRRLSQGAANKTVNLEFGTLRSILKRNKVWAEIQPDVRMLPVPQEFGRALSLEEEAVLLKVCAESRARHLWTLVMLALCTCMRKSELTDLKWKYVDLIAAVLMVAKSKTEHGANRRIPLNPRALAALKAWAAQFPSRQPEHYVFPSESYGPPRSKCPTYGLDPDKPVHPETAWKLAKHRANIKVRFHDLRHTGCTRMLEGRTSFPTVARIMGWSPSTTVLMAKRYGHLDKALRDAVGLLDSTEPRSGDQANVEQSANQP
jgi:integrase